MAIGEVLAVVIMRRGIKAEVFFFFWRSLFYSFDFINDTKYYNMIVPMQCPINIVVIKQWTNCIEQFEGMMVALS